MSMLSGVKRDWNRLKHEFYLDKPIKFGKKKSFDLWKWIKREYRK